jgi:telomere length regulation protein
LGEVPNSISRQEQHIKQFVAFNKINASTCASPNDEKDMTDLLTAVSTRQVNDTEPLIREVKSLSIQEDTVSVYSAEDALSALKNQPGRSTVSNVLKYLTTEGFSLLLPEPLNASIAHQLVNDTVPNYWTAIKTSTEAKRFAKVFRNPTCLGHLVTRLRSLIADSRQKKAPGEARNTAEHISNTLDVLELTLRGEETTHLILRNVLEFGKTPVQTKLIWSEFLAQAVSGRILSIAAEAEDVLKGSEASRVPSWIADGKDYAAWLGRNSAVLIERGDQSEEFLSAVVELFSKALGYTGMTSLKIVNRVLTN